MKLSELKAHLEAQGISACLEGDDVEVLEVSRDSRMVTAGWLFCALPGERRDGSEFVAMAKERGASAVLVESEHATKATLPRLIVSDAREAMAFVAHAVHGDPTSKLKVIGVTGTNGKTTTTSIVDGVFRKLGLTCALVGTVMHRIADEVRKTRFTTPESDELARICRQAVDAGCTHLVMEVSSHGLALNRVDGVQFDVAAFTNLTQDHLDFHNSMEDYGAAKRLLFTKHTPAMSVIHVGDTFGAELADFLESENLPTHVTRVFAGAASEHPFLGITAETTHFSRDGIRATLRAAGEHYELTSNLVGAHNLENLLVAVGIASALGFSIDEAVYALSSGVNTPGRLERVISSASDLTAFPQVLVDYAHTPDALEKAVTAVREVTEENLIVVFGCGGDRDAEKRPLMGAAAAAADRIVVTSDNPRTESPEAIIAAITPGLEGKGVTVGSPDEFKNDAARATVIVDRKDAINLAIECANAKDSVLIAGKGHEDYQIIGQERFDFDDRVIAQKALRRWSELGASRGVTS